MSRLRAPCATRLHSDGHKYRGGRQIIVLDPLVSEAFSAAAPAEITVAWMWDAAYVSGTRDQGTSVAPLGLLPSFLNNPIGSLLAGICAFLIARQKGR